MSNSNNISNSTILSLSSSDIIFSNIVRFWLYLIPNILGIISSLFSLYHLIFDRRLRQALNNHVIIVLLIICLIFELTNIPWNLYYFLYGIAWYQTRIFALIWFFIDVAFYTTQVIVFSWATIERHILIFYDRWVLTKKKRFFVHYLPLIILLIYCFIWYYFIILNPFCENVYNYSVIRGIVSLCSYNNPILPKYNLICHQLIPTIIIAVFSIGLLLRVVFQKSRLHRSINWRKQRKMTIQLLSISMVYLIFNIPWSTIYLAHYFGLPRTSGAEFRSYAAFFGNYLLLSFSMISCLSLPELRVKIRILFCYQTQRRRIIVPVT